MSVTVSVKKAHDLVVLALKANLVPILHGSPAIGKSAIVKEIAKQFDLKLIDLRLSQCEPPDLQGFATVVNGRGTYVPMDFFPLDDDPLPLKKLKPGQENADSYRGWLLFLDELTSAQREVQSPAYKLILDKEVGNRALHPACAMVAAGNLETDGAIVEAMSSALSSRLVHLEVQVDTKEWLEWANGAGLDHRVTSFIEFRPDKLYTFKPGFTDFTYSSPRTWEFVNGILQHEAPNTANIALFAGAVGEGLAREFRAFCDLQDRFPKFDNIVSNPSTTAVPSEPSVLYALCGALAANTTEANADAVMTYLRRMPAEFQVVSVRSMYQRNKRLLGNTHVNEWMRETGSVFF
jgi:hypothetical protein